MQSYINKQYNHQTIICKCQMWETTTRLLTVVKNVVCRNNKGVFVKHCRWAIYALSESKILYIWIGPSRTYQDLQHP